MSISLPTSMSGSSPSNDSPINQPHCYYLQLQTPFCPHSNPSPRPNPLSLLLVWRSEVNHASPPLPLVLPSDLLLGVKFSPHGGMSCLNATAIWVHLHTGGQLTRPGPGLWPSPRGEGAMEGDEGRGGQFG